MGRSHRRALPWTIATPLAMVVLIVISVIWLKSPVGNIVGFALALTFGIGTAAMQHVFMIRTLAPLVAGLPTTTERMTFREQIKRLVMSAPYWLLILVGALVGLASLGTMRMVVVNAIDEGWIDREAIVLSSFCMVLLLCCRGSPASLEPIGITSAFDPM